MNFKDSYFKNSPLLHFITGTLWFVIAAVIAYKMQSFPGFVFRLPILTSIVGIGYYARGIYLIAKNRQQNESH